MKTERRARMVLNHVLGKDHKWGQAGPPRSETTDKPSRIISDDCRWSARVTREDQKGPDGQLWDLIEVFAYGQHRMTAIFRDDGMELRVFSDGTWDDIFTVVGSCI